MTKGSGSCRPTIMREKTLSRRTWLAVMNDDELATLHANYLAAIERVEAEMRFRDGAVE